MIYYVDQIIPTLSFNSSKFNCYKWCKFFYDVIERLEQCKIWAYVNSRMAEVYEMIELINGGPKLLRTIPKVVIRRISLCILYLWLGMPAQWGSVCVLEPQ